jgi:hypothetical protein
LIPKVGVKDATEQQLKTFEKGRRRVAGQYTEVSKMAKMEGKSLNKPDEVRTFDKGKLELITIGGRTVGRATFQPGWRWSQSVKPLVNTKKA